MMRKSRLLSTQGSRRGVRRALYKSLIVIGLASAAQLAICLEAAYRWRTRTQVDVSTVASARQTYPPGYCILIHAKTFALQHYTLVAFSVTPGGHTAVESKPFEDHLRSEIGGSAVLLANGTGQYVHVKSGFPLVCATGWAERDRSNTSWMSMNRSSIVLNTPRPAPLDEVVIPVNVDGFRAAVNIGIWSILFMVPYAAIAWCRCRVRVGRMRRGACRVCGYPLVELASCGGLKSGCPECGFGMHSDESS